MFPLILVLWACKGGITASLLRWLLPYWFMVLYVSLTYIVQLTVCFPFTKAEVCHVHERNIRVTNCSFDTGTLFFLLAFSHLKSQIPFLSHNFISVSQVKWRGLERLLWRKDQEPSDDASLKRVSLANVGEECSARGTARGVCRVDVHLESKHTPGE